MESSRAGVSALRPNGRGDLTEDALVWKHLRGVPYVSTPVVDLGRVWMVKDGGIVTMLDSMTGERLNEERVPGTGRYFASPIAGDGKVYTASEQGVVTVIANQPEWKVISSHPFEEAIYATPVPVGNSLLIRTAEALYRFE
jgi:outer membrane protein assembly factor BamB